MARKLDSADSDSSLSPVADAFIEQVESKAAVAPPANGKKRKAAGETTAPRTTKRTKKATATVADNNDEADAVTKDSPRLKRRAAKKVKVEEQADEVVQVDAEGSGDTKATTKKKTTTARKKKTVYLAPLADRTKDTELLLGAHVSIAGGTFSTALSLNIENETDILLIHAG